MFKQSPKIKYISQIFSEKRYTAFASNSHYYEVEFERIVYYWRKV